MPAPSPGVVEVEYEIPARGREVIDGASGVPTCGLEPEAVEGVLEASARPAWGLEVVGGGFGPRAWDPVANEGDA